MKKRSHDTKQAPAVRNLGSETLGRVRGGAEDYDYMLIAHELAHSVQQQES